MDLGLSPREGLISFFDVDRYQRCSLHVYVLIDIIHTHPALWPLLTSISGYNYTSTYPGVFYLLEWTGAI